jgi:2'-5' RNA ligase
MAEQVRAFIAVELPEEVADGIWEVQDTLQAYEPMRALRWVEPDDAHITMKFLGDLPIPRLPAIVDALDSVAANWEPFQARLGPLGAFPNVHRPNNLWLAVTEGDKALIHLYNAVEVALKRLGFKPERGDFSPHVTLARLPRSITPEQQRAVGDLVGMIELPEVPPFTVSAVALVLSELTPDGPIYTRVGNSPFGALPPDDPEWEDELE